MEVIHDHRVLNHQIDDPLLCADLLLFYHLLTHE